MINCRSFTGRTFRCFKVLKVLEIFICFPCFPATATDDVAKNEGGCREELGTKRRDDSRGR